METLSVKGVTFRLDGLPDAAAGYLRSKLKRAGKRERERGSLLHRLLGSLLPADYARMPVESLVSGRVLVVGCAGGIETMRLGAVPPRAPIYPFLTASSTAP